MDLQISGGSQIRRTAESDSRALDMTQSARIRRDISKLVAGLLIWIGAPRAQLKQVDLGEVICVQPDTKHWNRTLNTATESNKIKQKTRETTKQFRDQLGALRRSEFEVKSGPRLFVVRYLSFLYFCQVPSFKPRRKPHAWQICANNKNRF